jgi:hypothetical protein
MDATFGEYTLTSGSAGPNASILGRYNFNCDGQPVQYSFRSDGKDTFIAVACRGKMLARRLVHSGTETPVLGLSAAEQQKLGSQIAAAYAVSLRRP